MTAVSADNIYSVKTKQFLPDGYMVDLPVAAATTIYKNTFVGLVAGTAAPGYLTSYVAGGQGASPTGTHFTGIALAHVDNSTGAAGAKTCPVQISGIFEYPLSAAAQLDVGKPVFVTDNATLSLAQTANGTGSIANNAFVGTIVGVPASGYVIVEMLSHSARNGYGGGLLTVTAEVDFAAVLNDEVYLVYPTQNHNGLYLCEAYGVITEAFVCTSAAGVVTLVHTEGTDTTIGCVLTGADAKAAGLVVQGVGGRIDIGTTLTSAIVTVPADKACIAKVTTLNAGGSITGKVNIHARFALI